MTKINRASLDGLLFDQSRLCGNLSGLCAKECVAREIESTDTRIDRLVYELYGLSKEEINI